MEKKQLLLGFITNFRVFFIYFFLRAKKILFGQAGPPRWDSCQDMKHEKEGSLGLSGYANWRWVLFGNIN